MDSLELLIYEFWEWTELPVDMWHVTDIVYLSKNTFDFPNIGAICNACFGLINAPLTPKEIDLFLMGLAIDSEDEDILEKCKEEASDQFLYKIATRGIHFPQSEARWQVAELLRRQIPNRDYFLNVLLADSHEYVRRRAYNVFCDLVQT